jgi:hypothetical protein
MTNLLKDIIIDKIGDKVLNEGDKIVCEKIFDFSKIFTTSKSNLNDVVIKTTLSTIIGTTSDIITSGGFFPASLFGNLIYNRAKQHIAGKQALIQYIKQKEQIRKIFIKEFERMYKSCNIKLLYDEFNKIYYTYTFVEALIFADNIVNCFIEFFKYIEKNIKINSEELDRAFNESKQNHYEFLRNNIKRIFYHHLNNEYENYYKHLKDNKNRKELYKNFHKNNLISLKNGYWFITFFLKIYKKEYNNIICHVKNEYKTYTKLL